jgi:hypothetical protein
MAPARKCLLLAFLTALASTHAAGAEQRAIGMKQFTNKAWRWTVSYPAGWTLDSTNPAFIVIRSAGESALCGIHSGPVDRFNTVNELTEFMLAHDRKFFGDKKQKFTVLSRAPIRLARGITGNELLVEIGPGGRSRRLHVLADGRGFAVDCEGYSKTWSRLDPHYRRIIASFAVSK